MSRREEFVGVRTIEAADVYGEGQHLYNMWLRTEEPIVRCRDCKYHQLDDMYGSTCVHVNDGKYEQWEVELDGFCAWGERKNESTR